MALDNSSLMIVHDSSEENSLKIRSLAIHNSGAPTNSMTLFWVIWTSLTLQCTILASEDTKMRKPGTAGKRKQ